MQRELQPLTGVYYVLMAGTLWSIMGLGIRLMGNADVWQILLYRSISLVIFLYFVILIRSKKNPIRIIFHFHKATFIAAIGLFIAYSGGIYSVQHTTVANAMLLFASAPFITTILAYFILKEKIQYYTLIAIILAVIGIGIMVIESIESGSLKGSLAGVISAFGFSIFTIALRLGKHGDMLPSVFLSGLLAISLTTLICSYQGLELLLEPHDAILALGLGIFQVGLGLVFYTIGSKTVPAAELTLLSLAEVLLGPFWVWLFLGEKTSQLTLLGGAVLFTAIIYNSTMFVKIRKRK